MIYIVRPEMPGLQGIIDAVMEGPAGYKDGEAIRQAFGRDALAAATADGRSLTDEDLGTPKFIEWLEAHGFKIVAYEEVDSIVSADAVRNWNARIVDGPNVRNIPPTDESSIPRDASGKPLVVGRPSIE